MRMRLRKVSYLRLFASELFDVKRGEGATSNNEFLFLFWRLSDVVNPDPAPWIYIFLPPIGFHQLGYVRFCFIFTTLYTGVP